MQRRQYLATAAFAAAAGCSSLSGEDDDDGGGETTTTDDGGSVSPWRKWLPANEIQEQPSVTLFANDVTTMREEFPRSAYRQFDLSRISSTYGIETSDMSWFLGLRQSGQTTSAVIVGSFDPANVVESLDPPEGTVEQQGSYRILDNAIAVSDSAIIITPEYQTYVDVRAGETQRLGAEDDGWAQLLSALEGGTILTATPGTPPYHGNLDAERTGVSIRAADSGGVRMTEHLHFESAERARTVAENRRDELIQQAKSDPDSTLVSFERTDARIRITVDSPDFSALS
jgi:hypothetical protein